MGLVERCDDDVAHSKNVARLALELYDSLEKEYDFSPEWRVLLEAASLLANVGLIVSHSRHHLHSYYVIRNSDLVGFTDHEIELIALIARYHRKGTPKPSHNDFANLSEAEQQLIIFLAGILRVAIGLDRSHDGRVTRLDVEIKKFSRYHCQHFYGSDRCTRNELIRSARASTTARDSTWRTHHVCSWLRRLTNNCRRSDCDNRNRSSRWSYWRSHNCR